MARPLSFRWDEEFVARIDEARGLVPRSAFVRAAVEQALASEGRGSEDPGVSLPSLPAPAERPSMEAVASAEPDDEAYAQALAREMPPIARYLSQPGPNVENVRSSAQAKRGTGPRPKGKR